MLLETLEDILIPKGYRIRQQHGPQDFIKITFEVGEETPQGQVITAIRKRDGQRKVYGYVA